MVTSALGQVHENVQTARWSCVTLAGAPYRLTPVGQPDRNIIRTHESNPIMNQALSIGGIAPGRPPIIAGQNAPVCLALKGNFVWYASG
ncbi:MAG: hypothetical protein ACI9N0_002738 [Ilumatobacter sp.]|jgi:hypothetical protein